MNAFSPGRRTFIVTIALASDPTKTATKEMTIDADDIYQAGVDAELRYLARCAEFHAGLRADTHLDPKGA